MGRKARRRNNLGNFGTAELWRKRRRRSKEVEEVKGVREVKERRGAAITCGAPGRGREKSRSLASLGMTKRENI
jgi:hypothetical protein